MAGINLAAYILLVTVGQAMQRQYVKPRTQPGVDSVQLQGHEAPKGLLAILPQRPAVVLVFPSCSECSVDSPNGLKSQPFKNHIFVVLPGVGPTQLGNYKAIGPKLSFLSAPESLSVTLGIEAAPRFFAIDAAGIISYVQPSYVHGESLYKVANAIRG